jgi:hypothetical protein
MKKLMLVIVIVIVILLLICLCCFFFLINSEDKTYSQAQLIDKIKDDTGLIISNNYKVINFKEDDSGFKPKWIAKIEIPKSFKGNFIKQIRSRSVGANHISAYNRLSTAAKWWNPQNSIITKWYSRKTNELMYVVVSEENSGTFVYIECFH